MGQDHSHIPPNQGLQPGIYRIVSASAGTAISISSYGYDRIETWGRTEDDSQKVYLRPTQAYGWLTLPKWLVQRSGDGYTFNNRKHNTSYIVVGSTDVQSRVYASKFPTTWELLEQGDYYFINKPGQDRVFDLHDWGSARNGNKIHIRPRDGHPCKHWKFEYLEDDTKRFIEKYLSTDSKEMQYVETIAHLRKQVDEAREDASKKSTLLSDCKDDLRRFQEGFNENDCCRDMHILKQTDQNTFHMTNIYNL